MGLSAYKQKRSFDKTPEPSGKKHKSSEPLRFVIQKHQASHLHYDFRLEMEGVLKSWAVPKGPSLNPADKRLAMMVEDHPYEYRTFEGIIPKGNYGAGTVIIWDEGTYEPAEQKGKTKADNEKELLSQLHKGNIKIILKGKKIKGEFTLVKTRGGDQENAWLLMKKADKYASEEDITLKDKSVISNMNLEKVAATSTNEWQSNRSSTGALKTEKKSAEKKATTQTKQPSKKVGGIKKAMPSGITPMLATLVDKAFDDPNWIYEVKWDGYRALAFVKKGKVELLSRNNISYNSKFAPIVSTLEELGADAVIDGEIIAMNSEGNSDFQLLQAWQKSGMGELVYYAFDLLWLNGYSLANLPLLERKERLRELVENFSDDDDSILKYSDHVVEAGKAFFELAVKAGLEGVIAKKADSEYLAGTRSKNWLKIKTHQAQEAVIAGFTKGRGSRQHFGALVLGIYQENKLHYIGHSGSGFDEKLLAEIYALLKPLVTDEMPFDKKPKTNMPVVWVKPELVCEVKFQEWTRDGLLRHPIFLGIREDKDPKDVKRELPKSTGTAVKQSAEEEKEDPLAQPIAIKGAKKANTKKAPDKPKAAGIELFDASAKKQTVKMDGQSIPFTNLDKLYWKKEKITKADMLNYYSKIGEYILPYMKDRPQSLNRHPDGMDGKSFYQKNVAGKVPAWVKTYHYTSDTDGKKSEYFVCADMASLLYIANLGCIEMNPWHSRVQAPTSPDWCIIDLDPGEISFDKVIEAANVVKQVLDGLEIPSWCKTSGSTGLHIYIPLGAKYSFEQSRQLAELLVTFVHDEIPKFTSLERNPAKRKTKIYLDYLQNREIQTIAAPYSLRPKPGATVSTPLHWDEVKKGLKISNFTINNIFDRLKVEGDLFGGVLGPGIDLEDILAKVTSYLK